MYIQGWLSSIFLILAATAAFAHPGKTDYQDGHKCLKNCEDWEMNYDEYHLHDKDRNALSMKGRNKPPGKPAPKQGFKPEPLKQEGAAVSEPESPQPKSEESRTITYVYQRYSLPVEEGFRFALYEGLLLGVAGVLLFVLLFLRIKERGNNTP